MTDTYPGYKLGGNGLQDMLKQTYFHGLKTYFHGLKSDDLAKKLASY